MSVYIENIKMEENWKNALKEEFRKDYFTKIKDFLLLEKTQ